MSLDLDQLESEAKAIIADWASFDSQPERDNQRILNLISELRQARFVIDAMHTINGVFEKIGREEIIKALKERLKVLENENIRLTERNKWAEERLASDEEVLKKIGKDKAMAIIEAFQLEAHVEARAHFEKYGEKK